jgi:hypothetical protein
MLSPPELICAMRGRAIKFTPERLEQIKNLVERGMCREDIATTIGVTVGSLQVTCSRVGISLRRPKAVSPMARLTTAPDDDEPKPEGNGGPEGARPLRERPQLSLVIRRGDQERRIELDLPDDVVNGIALEAAFSNENFGQVIARHIINGVRKE